MILGYCFYLSLKVEQVNRLAKTKILTNGLREWWRRRRNMQEQIENENQPEQVEIEIDRVFCEDLEERLERVYIRLLEVNANRRNNINETQLLKN